MSPPPRRGVPAQTLPPEDLELTSKRVGWFRGILAAALAAAAIGWAAREWSASHATKDDVSESRAASAATLDQLRTEAAKISERVAVVEEAVADLRSDVKTILTHVLAISKATDARVPATTLP